MAVPRLVKATTTAMATNAAATAYSESSRPVSSRRKFLIIFFAPLPDGTTLEEPTTRFTRVRPQLKRAGPHSCCVGLSVDGRGKRVNLSVNGGAEGRESSDDCDRNQGCRNGIFRQLKTGFIAKEFPNHFVCSFSLVMAWDTSFAFFPVERKPAKMLWKAHDIRATLDCGSPRLLRDWDSALTVRRPKPLSPLTTAPLRVSVNSMSPFSATTMARAARIKPNASTGAVIAITASETTSFVVKAFMRSFCNIFDTSFATRPWPRELASP